MRASLIVPCYNEEKRLDGPAFLRALDEQEALRFHFVNDGSKDGTLETLHALRRQAPGRITVTDQQPNQGKAEAVRQGLLAELARSDEAGDGLAFIGYWDADLATPLEELRRFVEIAEGRDPIDLVIGSRVRLLGRHIDRKFYRHTYGRAFATVVGAMLDLPVRDTQCGAKLMRITDVTRQVLREPFMSRWVFDVELLARLVIAWGERGEWATDKIVEHPLMRWTDVPGSKIGPKDALRAIYELGRIERRYGARLRSRHDA